MACVNIKATKIGRALRVIEIIRGFESIAEKFTDIKILRETKKICDLELSWLHERTITGVIADGDTKTLSYLVPKKANLSFRLDGMIFYASRLGKMSAILSNKPLEELNLTPFNFNLIDSLSQTNGRILSISDIRVVDLPIEDIPATHLTIPTCTLESLMSLVHLTPARVSSINIRLNSEMSLTVQSAGSLKLKTEDDVPWAEAVGEVHSIISSLQTL